MDGVLLIDTRQQKGKHEMKDEWWALHGVPTARRALGFGDYMIDGSNRSIDTKRSIAEVAQNIGGKQHARFRRECQRAADAGYRLIVLVENTEGVACLSDLVKWVNSHCKCCAHFRKGSCDPRDMSAKCAKHGTRKPIQGERLAKAMKTMSGRYGVLFEFCKPEDTARRICELLGVRYERDAAGGA